MKCNDYWQKVCKDWKTSKTECRLKANELPDQEKSIVDFDKEDSMFWNYCGIYIKDIPHWKTPPDPITPHPWNGATFLMLPSSKSELDAHSHPYPFTFFIPPPYPHSSYLLATSALMTGC